MAITLTQVAQEAGVSLASASRAFKNPKRVSESTRQRVLEAATKLGYTSSESRRAITVALIVPDIGNPVIGEQVVSIQDQAWPDPYRFYLESIGDNSGREIQALESLRDEADGILMLSPRSSPEEIRAVVRDTPLVVMNGATWQFCPTLLMDATRGIRQAVEHLVALGHRHLAFVPGSSNSWPSENRRFATERAAAEWGAKLTVVGSQHPSFDGGMVAAASVVASGATAVIGYNDLIALGIRYGAQTLGLHCPQDLSIVGVDNYRLAANSEPSMTTVAIDVRQVASRAFMRLAEAIRQRRSAPSLETIDSQLIVRGSTGLVREGELNSRMGIGPSRRDTVTTDSNDPALDLKGAV